MGKQYQTRDVKASTLGLAIPDQVSVALAGVAESAKEGLLALAVGAGLQVLQTLMEESVTTLADPKDKHNPDRTAVRHGHEHGWVTLGDAASQCSVPGCVPPTARVSCPWPEGCNVPDRVRDGAVSWAPDGVQGGCPGVASGRIGPGLRSRRQQTSADGVNRRLCARAGRAWRGCVRVRVLVRRRGSIRG